VSARDTVLIWQFQQPISSILGERQSTGHSWPCPTWNKYRCM